MKIYTLPNCHKCKELKAIMELAGTKPEEVNALEHLDHLGGLGFMEAPVYFDGKSYFGYDRAKEMFLEDN